MASVAKAALFCEALLPSLITLNITCDCELRSPS